MLTGVWIPTAFLKGRDLNTQLCDLCHRGAQLHLGTMPLHFPPLGKNFQRTLLWPALFAATLGHAQYDCQHSKAARGTGGLRDGGTGTFWPMDLLHQRLELDLTLASGIAGSCMITATPREAGIQEFPLHLKSLAVDSVVLDGESLSFTHTDELLTIELPVALAPGDTFAITVHYGGNPAVDPSGFGGWYNTGTYIYNLGVAFTDVPHSYGRAWFPCVDNFTERSSYEFIVRTHAGRNAWCNGELVSETALGGDTLVRHWRIDETMPAYLVSVAASNYVSVHDTFTSIGGAPVPVALVARPPDTTNMKNSFINLQQAFDRFEAWFGAYRWNKVGYVLTPLGAMEHSTSIHYPQFIANGNLQYENVMAHELAHQWWGNLVTCDKAEEMYINEGFAEYLSYLFLEAVYGPGRYRNTVRSNHRKMVHRAHLIDQGWWALADVPQEWTYGEHSYNKGADVLHTLRGYLGDALFQLGLRTFLETNAFRSVNSELLRDHLTAATGVDMTDFFKDWIFQPGWAAFEVDSFTAVPDGNAFAVTVHVQQKQRGPSAAYTNVPLRVTFLDADGSAWRHPDSVFVGTPLSSFTIPAPFIPATVVLNEDERISLAITVDVDTLTQPSAPIYANADLRLSVQSISGPIPIRLEEYWVAADPEVDEPFAYVVSPDRWWRIVGNFPPDALINGRIQYDGRTLSTASYDVGLMQDVDGVAFREDSLVLLYRPDQRSPWSPYPEFTVNPLSSPTDKLGRIDFNQVRAGEYTLAWRKSAVGISAAPERPNDWLVHPNPSSDHFAITWRGDGHVAGLLELVDAAGRRVAQQRIDAPVTVLSVQGLAPGTYLLRHVPLQGPARMVDRVVVAR